MGYSSFIHFFFIACVLQYGYTLNNDLMCLKNIHCEDLPQVADSILAFAWKIYILHMETPVPQCCHCTCVIMHYMTILWTYLYNTTHCMGFTDHLVSSPIIHIIHRVSSHLFCRLVTKNNTALAGLCIRPADLRVVSLMPGPGWGSLRRQPTHVSYVDV